MAKSLVGYFRYIFRIFTFYLFIHFITNRVSPTYS